MRFGMYCKKGDVILIRFPFTDLSQTKKRPVLVVKDQNDYGDFVCFQITSRKMQSYLLEILSSDYKDNELKINSFVKYDKCFTLNKEIVDKKLSALNNHFLQNLKEQFCKQL